MQKRRYSDKKTTGNTELTFITFAIMSLLLGRIAPFFYLVSSALFIYLILANVVRKGAIKRPNIILLLGIALVIIVNIVFNGNGYIDLAKNFFMLYVSYSVLCDKKIDLHGKQLKIFELAVNIYLLVMLLYSTSNKGIMNNSIFFGAWDKNMISVISLFMFYLSLRTRRYYYTFLNIIFLIMTGSRLLLISDALLLLYEFIKTRKLFKRVLEALLKKKRLCAIIAVFYVIPTIFAISASYFMTYNLSASSITSYKESLNDTSNAIRARSNIYAISEIKRNKTMLFYGYDDNIREELGGGTIDQHKTFRGYRVVQPHNLVLNLTLRYGVIAMIFYLLVVALIIKEKINYDNAGLFIAYALCNTFLHLLLGGVFLPFFIFMMSIVRRKDNDK